MSWAASAYSQTIPRAFVVRRENGMVTWEARGARPLEQVVAMLAEEYDLMVDFEEPPYYSDSDLVDVTPANVRAAHPEMAPVRGMIGRFQMVFNESAAQATALAQRESVVRKVASDYNASGAAGRFEVRCSPAGRLAIIGNRMKNASGSEQPVVPVLDTPISVRVETRDAYTTVEVIVTALNEQSGIKVFAGLVPNNAFFQHRVTVGGDRVTARSLLQDLIAQTKLSVYWLLLYDPNAKTYGFNIIGRQRTPEGMRRVPTPTCFP
jgi:hypothetical protein